MTTEVFIRPTPLCRLAALTFATILTACQPATSPPGTGVTASATTSGVAPSFVQAACADCHGVEPNMISPNPGVPAFSDIANREGVTRESLIAFLRNAHNYPEQMDFDLDDDDIGEIADYLITLQNGDYRLPPS